MKKRINILEVTNTFVLTPQKYYNLKNKYDKRFFKDELLNSMKEVKAEEASEMLVSLTKIMDKFDIGEFDNKKEQGILSKIFKSAGNTIAKLFQKYDTMGYEIEKVYLLLKKYENALKIKQKNDQISLLIQNIERKLDENISSDLIKNEFKEITKQINELI